MTDAGSIYRIEVVKKDGTPVKLQVAREDGSTVKDFVAKIEQLKEHTGVEWTVITEFAFDALCGEARNVIASFEINTPSVKKNWPELKALLAQFYKPEKAVVETLFKYEDGSVTKIIYSTNRNISTTWDRMIRSKPLCGDDCSVCKDPKNAQYYCRTMALRSMEILQKSFILDRLPARLRPAAVKAVDVADFNVPLSEFCKELLAIEAQYKTEVKGGQVEEINSNGEVDAIGGNRNNRGRNGQRGGRNKGRGGRNNYSQRTSTSSNSSSYSSNSNSNYNGNSNSNYNNGNKKKKNQVIYCFRCKNWGYHIARECQIDLKHVTSRQYADVKPAINEIKDPQYEQQRSHLYESDETVSKDELAAAILASKSDNSIPLTMFEDNKQGFL